MLLAHFSVGVTSVRVADRLTTVYFLYAVWSIYTYTGGRNNTHTFSWIYYHSRVRYITILVLVFNMLLQYNSILGH